MSCAGGRSFVISPPTRTPEVSSNGGTQERAHFFDLIEEDELVPSAAKKGTVKGGATDDSGDLITRSRRQLHLPQNCSGCLAILRPLVLLAVSYVYRRRSSFFRALGAKSGPIWPDRGSSAHEDGDRGAWERGSDGGR